MPKSKSRKPANAHSSLDKSILYDGVSISNLAVIFDLDKRTVSGRIHGLTPTGTRNGYPTYSLAEACVRCFKPSEEQLREAVRRMGTGDLPVRMQKEFWDSHRSRQTFEENARDLWRTEDLVDVFTEVFKTFRTSVRLFVDAVDRDTEISVRQRGLLEQYSDDLLTETRRLLLENPKFAEIENSLASAGVDEEPGLFDDEPPDESADEEEYDLTL